MTQRSMLKSVCSSTFLFLFTFGSPALHAQDLVGSISKGPITPDGNVAGGPTGLLINLEGSLDPGIEGRTLLQGSTIEFQLPAGFVSTGTLPIADAFSSPTCGPNNFECSTVVMLQGWPQHPILPSVPMDEGPRSPQYSLTHEASSNTFTITANVDVTPGLAVPGPGIKGLVLVLNGFENPAAGTYDIPVTAETGPNGEVETGVGQITILPAIERSIHVSSQFNPGTPNTIFQTALPGERTELAHDFLMWESDGSPLLGVEIAPTADPALSLLMQNGQQVGTVSVNGPEGASGFSVFTESASSLASSVNPAEAGRLTSIFQAGQTQGDYDITYTLSDGALAQMSATMYVTVVPEPSGLWLGIPGVAVLGILRRRRR